MLMRYTNDIVTMKPWHQRFDFSAHKTFYICTMVDVWLCQAIKCMLKPADQFQGIRFFKFLQLFYQHFIAGSCLLLHIQKFGIEIVVELLYFFRFENVHSR